MAEKIGSLEFDIIGVDNISDVVDASNAKIQGLVDSTVKGGSAMDTAFNKIKSSAGKTFGDINNVIQTNESEIRNLKSEYDRLEEALTQVKKVESLPGNDKAISEIINRKAEIEKEIAMRKGLVDEAKKSNTELASLEEKVTEKVKVNANAHTTLRTQIKAAREELSAMEMQGLRGTESYSVLQTKLGELTDQMMDTQAQASILANDQRGFQGVISGLGGISGAMSAAGGVYGMFAGENENLQKIMTKVQSLMAITIGLQQISQALDKDSAFMLVTVNGLKKWWNEITSKSVVVETAEAVATKAATAAKKGQTGEIVKGTVATAGNTAATTTGTVATKGLAGGFRLVGAAIKSIPGIGWLIIAVTAVVGAFALLTKKTREARKEQLEFNKKVADAVVEPITQFNKLSLQFKSFGNDMKAKEKFVKDNAKAFEELGVSVNSVAEAENVLVKNTQAFINSQIAKAKASIYMQQAQEKMKEAMDLRSKEELSKQTKDLVEGSAFEYTIGGKLYQGVVAGINATKDLINKQRLKQADELDKEIQDLYKKAINSESDAAKELEKAGINTAEKYAEGSLKALQEALSLKNEMFEKTNSGEERQRLKKEIDAIQKEIDKIDIRRSKTKSEDPFLEQLQKQKVVYDQIEKDLKSTDEKVVQSAKDKYDKLKNQGETYLKYLENERNKILSSGKQLSATQKKNIETLNKEISEMTQGKGSVLGEYSFTLQKEKIIQKYDKDIADIKNSIGTVDFETGITISEKDVEEAIKFLTEKKNKELEALIKNFYPEIDFEGILNEYADFEQQRILIQKKYDDIRKNMNKKNDADIKAGLPVTFTEANFKGVDTKQAGEMADVNRREIETIIKSSIQLSNIFTNIQSLSKKTARESIKDIKNISDYIISNGKTYLTPELQKYADKIRQTPEDLALFYETARNLQEEYVKETANPFDDIIIGVNELRKSYKLLEEAEKATTEEARRNATYQAKLSKEKGIEIISGYANKAADGIKQMTEAMREYAEASGDTDLMEQAGALGAVADNVSAAAQGFSKGGWIGAIVGGASNLLSQLITSLTQGKAQAVALEQALRDVELAAKNANAELLLSGENRETIFGTDAYGKFLDAIEVYKTSQREFEQSLLNYGNETLYGDEKKKWWEGLGAELFAGFGFGSAGLMKSKSYKQYQEAIEKGYSELEAMQVKTKDRSNFLNALGFGDKYTSLKDLYPRLFNSDGSLNVDQAKAFKSNEVLWNTLSSDQKQYFESVINNAELMNDALTAQREYLSSLFGGLGDEISNAFWQAATEGTDAMETIGDSIDDIVKKWIQQQAYMMLLQPMLSEIQYNMEQGMLLQGWTAEKALMFGVKLLKSGIASISDDYDTLVNSLAEYTGIDLKADSETDASSLSGAIKGASQESIDLLAGQTNAVRLNQVESMNILRSQLFHLAAISSGIATSNTYLRSIDEKINSNSFKSDPLRARGVTPSAL